MDRESNYSDFIYTKSLKIERIPVGKDDEDKEIEGKRKCKSATMSGESLSTLYFF